MFDGPNPASDSSLDALITSLQPVLRTLTKLAAAQGAAAPMVSVQNGTVAIVPRFEPRADFLAAELAVWRHDAMRDARWRARTYVQRPRRPQIEAARRRNTTHSSHS